MLRVWPRFPSFMFFNAAQRFLPTNPLAPVTKIFIIITSLNINHIISYIFKKDLGTALELPGTKECFRQFNKHAQTAIATLLTEGKGNLIISDKKYGDLKYNNLKRILNDMPVFERMCTSSYVKGQSKFDIKIHDGMIKCNETTLVMEDPYDGDDYYSHEEKSL